MKNKKYIYACPKCGYMVEVNKSYKLSESPQRIAFYAIMMHKCKPLVR